MTDEVIQELWRVKDGIARDHGYDLDALIVHLRSREQNCGHRIIDRAKEIGVEHIPAGEFALAHHGSNQC